MKKNFLFGLLALMLAGFGFGGISMASDCEVGTNVELVSSLANSDCEKIILNGNVSVVDSLNVLRDISLDLNGNTISKASGTIILVGENGNLTIDDSSDNSVGKIRIESNTSDGTVISVKDGGTVKINKGNYEGGTAVYVKGEGSEVIINDGNFVGTKAGNRAAIHAVVNGIITINGGTFVAQPSDSGKPQKVIYAGANTNKCNSQSLAENDERYVPGKIIINDGDFTGRFSRSNLGEYEIKGGTFTPYNNKTAGVGCDYNACTENSTSDPVSCHDVEGFDSMLNEGYIAKINGGSSYKVFQAFTVIWKIGETVVETDTDVVINSKPEFNGSTPTKQADNSYTYSFKGWSKDGTDTTVTLADEKITSDVTYTAVFNQTSKPTYSGGGGSSRSSSKTTTTDDTKKAEETTKDETKVDETKADEPKTDENKVDGNNDSIAPATFSQEFQDAYEFAYKNGITTMDSIEKADMYGPLTRVAMAKMLSQYAINVLGKEPDTTKVVPTFSDVDAKLDADYNNGVTLAYQLGIMGINVNKYRPFDLVTRAEFGTALSRMLYGLADGEGDQWYKTHLDMLMNEAIITNDTPNLQELRGYVMIMLMRSAQK